MIVEINDEEQRLKEQEQQLLTDILQTAARIHKVGENRELSVMIVGNEEIRKLNSAYRGKDSATDVLSFAYDETPSVEETASGMPIGDIIISVDKVGEQAREFGHSEERELAYLAVHGFLHLVGYDHQSIEDKKTMREKEEAIMKDFALAR